MWKRKPTIKAVSKRTFLHYCNFLILLVYFRNIRMRVFIEIRRMDSATDFDASVAEPDH